MADERSLAERNATATPDAPPPIAQVASFQPPDDDGSGATGTSGKQGLISEAASALKAPVNVGAQTSRFKAPPAPPRPGMVPTDLPISGRSRAYFSPDPAAGLNTGALRNNAYRPGPIAAAAAAADPNPLSLSPSALKTRQTNYGTQDRGAGFDASRPGPVAAAAAALAPGPVDPNAITRTGPAGTTDRFQPGLGGKTDTGTDYTNLPGRGVSYASGTGGYQPPESGRAIEQTNDLARSQLNQMRATEQQNRDLGQQRTGLVTSAIEARMDQEKAKREADVAGFSARNGADVILRGSPTFDGRNPIADAAARNAGVAEGRLQSATATAVQRKTASDNAATPNYIQQAAEQQKTQLEAQKGVREQQSGTLAQQVGKQGLAVGGQQLQKGEQELQHGAFGLQIQSHLTDLQKRAAGTGPDAQAANNALALYQKAQSGKGGPITDEDILGAHKDMVVRAIQMGGADALKSLPSFSEYKQSLLDNGAPPADWMTRARTANPGASEAALTELYKSKKLKAPSDPDEAPGILSRLLGASSR